MMELHAPHMMAEKIETEGASAVPEMNEDDIRLIQKYHQEQMKIGHACMEEAAYLMAICPESVHLDRLGIEDGHSRHLTRKFRQNGIEIRLNGIMQIGIRIFSILNSRT